MITVTPDSFADREEAVSKIRASGLHLAEAEMSQEGLTGSPHIHPYDVDIYLLEGELELDEPRRGLRHRLTAGTKALVPAGTLHAETCPGRFHAVFGVSVDPAPIMAARKAELAAKSAEPG
jgi:quercetin dioxygenase-like cupin family protein